MDWRTEHGDAFAHTKALVTGGAGFIGSHLCETLAALGAEVVAIDDLSGGSWSNLDGFGDHVQQVTASILDRDALAEATAGCRYVFHQAALGSVPRSVEEPELYHQVNVIGTMNVLQAAAAAGVRRVMYAASSSAYGDPPEQGPKVETQPVLPRSPYAATKLAGEHQARAWAHSYGLDTASTRYFNIFGPRQNANSAYAAVIAAFAKALIADEAPTIYGDGEQSRDFTFVHNAVQANLLAARCEHRLDGEVFNVACADSVTLNDLFARMAHLLDAEHITPRYADPRPGDVRQSLADLTRTQTVLGYEPLVDFETGLAATVEWYRRVFA